MAGAEAEALPHALPPAPSCALADGFSAAQTPAGPLLAWVSGSDVCFALLRDGPEGQPPGIEGCPVGIDGAHRPAACCLRWLPPPLDWALVTAGEDSVLRCWDTRASVQLWAAGGGEGREGPRRVADVALPGRPLCLDAAPGVCVAGVHNGTVAVLRVATVGAGGADGGFALSAAETHRLGQGAVTAVSLSPQGALWAAVGYASGRVVVACIRTGATVAVFSEHTDAVQGAAWRAQPLPGGPSELLLATGGKDQRVFVAAVAGGGGRVLRELFVPHGWRGPRGDASGARRMTLRWCPAPEGDTLLGAAGTPGTVFAYDMADFCAAASDEARRDSKPQLHTLYRHRGRGAAAAAVSVCTAGEGAGGTRVASVGRDGRVYCAVMQRGGGKLAARRAAALRCLAAPVLCADAAASGIMVAATSDLSAVLWSPGARGAPQPDEIANFAEQVTTVAVEQDVPDGGAPVRVAYGLAAGAVGVRHQGRAAGGKRGKGDKGKGKKGKAGAEPSDWGDERFETSHRAPVCSVAFAAGVWSGAGLAVFSLAADGVLYEHGVGLRRAAVNASSKLYHLRRGAVARLDPAGLAALPPALRAPGAAPLSSFVFGAAPAGPDPAPRRNFAVGTQDGRVDVWYVPGSGARAEPQLLATAQCHAGKVACLAFRPAGGMALLASGSDGGGLCVAALPAQDAPQLGLAARHAAAPTRHAGAVTTCRWSPAGDWLASGGSDGTVRLWRPAPGDAPGLQPVASVRTHTGRVLACAWGMGGLLLSCGDRVLRAESAASLAAAGLQAQPPAELEGMGVAEAAAAAKRPQGGEAPPPDAPGASKRRRFGTGGRWPAAAAAAQQWLQSGAPLSDADPSPGGGAGGEVGRALRLLLEAQGGGAEPDPAAEVLADLPREGGGFTGAGPLDAAACLLARGHPYGVAALPLWGEARWREGLAALAAACPGSPPLAACCLSAAGRPGAAARALAAAGLGADAALLCRAHGALRGGAEQTAALRDMFQPLAGGGGWQAAALGLLGQDNAEAALVLLQHGDTAQLQAAVSIAQARCRGMPESEQRAAALQRLQQRLQDTGRDDAG